MENGDQRRSAVVVTPVRGQLRRAPVWLGTSIEQSLRAGCPEATDPFGSSYAANFELGRNLVQLHVVMDYSPG